MPGLVVQKECRFVGGRSSKFWRYEITETDVKGIYVATYTWGRIGTTGQSDQVRGVDLTSMRWSADTRYQSKLDKGYKPYGDSGRPQLPSAPVRPQPAPARGRPAPEPESVVSVRKIKLRD